MTRADSRWLLTSLSPAETSSHFITSSKTAVVTLGSTFHCLDQTFFPAISSVVLEVHGRRESKSATFSPSPVNVVLKRCLGYLFLIAEVKYPILS